MEWLPQDVDDVKVAFPANVLDMMPAYDDIPREFRSPTNKWAKIQGDWFYGGLKNPSFHPKEGIDPKKAFRHLSCIQGSYEPKHEHKAAAVAYLMSLWFEDIQYEKGTPSGR